MTVTSCSLRTIKFTRRGGLQPKEVYPPWSPWRTCWRWSSSIHNPRITIRATTCASLTTFNILFKNKDDQGRTGALDRPNG
jgi:hypothetical protein